MSNRCNARMKSKLEASPSTECSMLENSRGQNVPCISPEGKTTPCKISFLERKKEMREGLLYYYYPFFCLQHKLKKYPTINYVYPIIFSWCASIFLSPTLTPSCYILPNILVIFVLSLSLSLSLSEKLRLSR